MDEVDGVLQAARAAGVGGQVEVSIPSQADTAFTVAQTRQPWVMSNNSVAVDGATGRITDASWFADWPLAAKLSAWGIQLHMGTMFGLANQLVLVGLAVALATVIVRGCLTWWRRRPTRRDRPVGRPPRRGALSQMPVGAAVTVVVLAAAIGWFVPLLGISLAASGRRRDRTGQTKEGRRPRRELTDSGFGHLPGMEPADREPGRAIKRLMP